VSHKEPERSLSHRIRSRSVRDIEELDRRGRLGDGPRPLNLATVAFVAMVTLGFGMFYIGRSSLPSFVLTAAVIGMLGISAAVWAGMSAGQYQSLLQLDDARRQLLAIYSDLDQERDLFRRQRHDANAVIAGMGAAFYALDPKGSSPEVVQALNSQLVHLRGILSTQSPDLDSYNSSRLVGPLEGFIALKGASVELDLPDDLMLAGSQSQTSRILQNLLDNAFKYGKGRGTSVSWETDGSEFVFIHVVDRGPGVDLAISEVVFDEGVRSASTHDGLGLGLAISRRLAEAQGGALWYEPRDNGGSKFVLKLRISASGAPT
jgi:two-component system osmolarity sensor histidine kinase EnvZ